MFSLRLNIGFKEAVKKLFIKTNNETQLSVVFRKGKIKMTNKNKR